MAFHPTLTFFTGASNTGKSHIFHCLDFSLGGPTPERDFAEANGYHDVFLEIATGEEVVTIRRVFDNEDTAHWFSGPLEDWDDDDAEELQVQASRDQPERSLNGRLVSAFGFDPSIPLVRNARGETQVLSFRTLSQFFLVAEEDVITKRSPVLPAQAFAATANRSGFSLMVSGEAPTAEEIERLRLGHQQRERAKQQAEVLEPLIEDLRAEIAEAGHARGDLERAITEIDRQLGELSESVAGSGDAVREHLLRRNDALRRAEQARRRLAKARELSTRFQLLAKEVVP